MMVTAPYGGEGRRAQRRFPGEPGQVKAVRQWLAGVLPPGCPVLDEAILLANELAVNACQHTASGKSGGSFQIIVQVDDTAIRVEVTDQGSAIAPRLQDSDLEEESGRGLQLVDGLATQWGVTGDHTSRTIWFELVLGEREF